MTTTTPKTGDTRTRALAAAVSKIRGRGFSISIERWLMVAGAILITIGIPTMLVGWYGAARTPYVFEQIPYLISGGLVGLAFTLLGGLLYFAYWMTRQVQETRRLSDRTEETMRRLESILVRMTPADAVTTTPTSANGSFVATAKGTMFHAPDCVVVAGRNDLRPVSPDEPGFEPCKICEPLASV
ncbi:MAG TPA: hypothetical protein VGB52_14675 [Actinomycetota bacterium]